MRSRLDIQLLYSIRRRSRALRVSLVFAPHQAYGRARVRENESIANASDLLDPRRNMMNPSNRLIKSVRAKKKKSHDNYNNPSSNHKLLCTCTEAAAAANSELFCGVESARAARAISVPESSSQPSAQISRRLRRSASPQVFKDLNLWDELELLFRAYQVQNERNQRQRQSPGAPPPQFRGNCKKKNSTSSSSSNSQAASSTLAPARQPRVGQAPQDRNQLAVGSGASDSTITGGGGGGGESVPTPPVKVIETAVFVDQALDNKFAGLSNGLVELNKLVLTIMNQVQYLFEYSSLQVAIKLKLVLIEHLRESERLIGLAAPSSERGDIDAYLSNFCNWQQNRLNREKRLWWDHAILLSGLDLYKATPGKNHSGVLGLAWVGGMCKGNYSCTINEASNFESAFVIAHEIGHSLGIMHDGQKNKCDPNQFIMSERTGAGKVHWSRCSNVYLNESIARNQLKCLDSEQNNQIDSLYDLAKLRSPGQVYTINEQCKLAFGSNYSSFVTQQAPFNALCRELWCVSGTWAKAAHPALEGSPCAGGQQELVCREGKCARVPSN